MASYFLEVSKLNNKAHNARKGGSSSLQKSLHSSAEKSVVLHRKVQTIPRKSALFSVAEFCINIYPDNTSPALGYYALTVAKE